MSTDTYETNAKRKDKTKLYLAISTKNTSKPSVRDAAGDASFTLLARLLGFGAVLGLLAFVVWGSVYTLL